MRLNHETFGGSRRTRVHDLETVAPLADELRQQRRRMLQIRVHHDDGVAARGREPRHQRALVTEVARQPYAAHAHVGSAQAR